MNAYDVEPLELLDRVGLGLISFYGFNAGRLAGAGVWVSLVQALTVGVIGGALIAFKALIH